MNNICVALTNRTNYSRALRCQKIGANYKRINSIFELRNEPLNYLRFLAANFVPIADSTTRFLKIS